MSQENVELAYRTADAFNRRDLSSSAFKPVRKACRRVHARLETLIERAKAQGTIRADATRVDVTVTIVGARAVRHVRPDDWRRMVQLGLDGLRARPKRR